MAEWASNRSEGPYDYAAEMWDAEPAYEASDYVREPEMTEGEKAALSRASRERYERMDPDERARWEAAIADPWAVSRG